MIKPYTDWGSLIYKDWFISRDDNKVFQYQYVCHFKDIGVNIFQDFSSKLMINCNLFRALKWVTSSLITSWPCGNSFITIGVLKVLFAKIKTFLDNTRKFSSGLRLNICSDKYRF